MKNKKSIFNYLITYFVIAVLIFVLPFLLSVIFKLIYYRSYNGCNLDENAYELVQIIRIFIRLLQIILPIITIIFGIIYTIKVKKTLKNTHDKMIITILSIIILIISIGSGITTYLNKPCELIPVKKPILYIYPTKGTNVKVTLEKKENLQTTYPKYNNGWEVFVKQNGDMYDKDGKYYYALYWDEKYLNKETFEEGFYVTKDNAIDFLEEKLSYIGLNDKERNEFIMYWLPVIEKNERNIINFDLTDEIQKENKMIIEPKPDSLLRVHINIKKVDKKINIKQQKLERFERKGYTAVEWGGTIY